MADRIAATLSRRLCSLASISLSEKSLLLKPAFDNKLSGSAKNIRLETHQKEKEDERKKSKYKEKKKDERKFCLKIIFQSDQIGKCLHFVYFIS